MYTYIKAVVLSRSTGAQYQEVDLEGSVVYSIYNTYREIALELSHPALTDHVYVDFNQLRHEFSSYPGTLAILLIELEDRALTTIPELPSTTLRYARYSDAVQACYKVETTCLDQAVTPTTPESDKHDLQLTRPLYQTDMRLVHTHCLVSVNGYFHPTDADTDGQYAYVRAGADSLHRCRNNQLGLLSFLDIGELTQIPITTPMLLANPDGVHLKDRVSLALPVSLVDKTPLVVLGGYLLFPAADVMWPSGDQTLTLNLGNMPLLERYYESRLALNLDALGLEEGTDGVDTTVFYSDTVMAQYLTLPQSFVVLVDTPALQVEKLFVQRSRLPGTLITYQEPVDPLFINHGRVADYWKRPDTGYWSLNITDDYFRHFLFSETEPQSLRAVTGNCLPDHPYPLSRGYFLEISARTT